MTNTTIPQNTEEQATKQVPHIIRVYQIITAAAVAITGLAVVEQATVDAKPDVGFKFTSDVGPLLPYINAEIARDKNLFPREALDEACHRGVEAWLASRNDTAQTKWPTVTVPDRPEILEEIRHRVLRSGPPIGF